MRERRETITASMKNVKIPMNVDSTAEQVVEMMKKKLGIGKGMAFAVNDEPYLYLFKIQSKANK